MAAATRDSLAVLTAYETIGPVSMRAVPGAAGDCEVCAAGHYDVEKDLSRLAELRTMEACTDP